jgi:hypothetical protein
MEKAHIIIQMDLYTRGFGDKINQMEKEFMNLQMVQYIRVNGKTTNCMELVFS